MDAITHPVPARRVWGLFLLPPLAALVLTPLALPRWAFMWLLAAGVFAGCKLLTWQSVSRVRISWQLQTAYLFAWPGLDARTFLLEKAPPCDCPALREWSFAFANTFLGAVLFWLSARQIPADDILLRGWVGMVGLALMLHFGVFHVLSCFWRRLGRNARPLMNWPVLATSVADFWSHRWNMAFRDVTHQFVFQPLTRLWGARTANLTCFGMSGLIHEAVISVPAGGGYGLPMLFFLLQGLALLAERSRAGRAIGLNRGWRGRLFTFLVVAGPAFLLFHPPFVRYVMVPFMKWAGALS